MIRTNLMLVPTALALALAGCNQPAPEAANAAAPGNTAAAAVDPVAVEKEVADFIRTYNGYYERNDLDAYFGSFDPSLTQWWATGRVGLKDYETMWRRGYEQGGGTSKAVVSDLKIHVGPSGDAAVATYLLTVTPRVNGKPGTKVERNQETDVLFKRNGTWKVYHVHYNTAAE
jgi:ketosteroid isomerase-like protein